MEATTVDRSRRRRFNLQRWRPSAAPVLRRRPARGPTNSGGTAVEVVDGAARARSRWKNRWSGRDPPVDNSFEFPFRNIPERTCICTPESDRWPTCICSFVIRICQDRKRREIAGGRLDGKAAAAVSPDTHQTHREKIVIAGAVRGQDDGNHSGIRKNSAGWGQEQREPGQGRIRVYLS
jgi:hypothetical protein